MDHKKEKLRWRLFVSAWLTLSTKTGNEKLIKEIEQLVYRPKKVYIPATDSARTSMMKDQISLWSWIWDFEPGTKKLALPKEERTFKLRFLSSGDIINAYIKTKKLVKAIQSTDKQENLGSGFCVVFSRSWKNQKSLTGQRLNELKSTVFA